MIFDNEFEDYGYTDIVAYSGKDITEEMVDDCMKICNEFYSKEFARTENLKTMVLSNLQMCFVFFDKVKDVVIGYSFWLPIKTKVFNTYIKSGKPLLEFDDGFMFNYKQDKLINLFLASEAYILGYDIKILHEAISDVITKRILDLAYHGIKVKYIAMEACSKFDLQFLANQIGFTSSFKKPTTTFFFNEFSPETIYKNSKFSDELIPFYKEK